MDASTVLSATMKGNGKDPASAFAYIAGPGGALVIKNEEDWVQEFVDGYLTSDELRTYLNEQTDGTKRAFF